MGQKVHNCREAVKRMSDLEGCDVLSQSSLYETEPVGLEDQDWFINQKLVNDGTGQNYGLDLTIERFMNKGFYYMVTASVFDSEYVGGDGITRNSRFNKTFVFNILGGKEWQVGRNHNNSIGLNE